MIGYQIPVSCRRCGGELNHAADGTVLAGTETGACASCSVCGARWLLIVHLRHVPSDERGAQQRKQQRAKAAV